jgi:hypothetical protein
MAHQVLLQFDKALILVSNLGRDLFSIGDVIFAGALWWLRVPLCLALALSGASVCLGCSGEYFFTAEDSDLYNSPNL